MKKLLSFTLLLFAAVQAWAVAPEEGKVYKIVSPTRGNLKIAEDILEHTVYCPVDLNGKVYQYWILEKSGSLWTIKNAYTGRYLQNHNTFYQNFTTGTNAATFDIIENKSVGADYYTIKNGNGGMGLHCDAGAALVPYMADSDSPGGSSWKFELVNISEEELAAAQKEYADFAKVSEGTEALVANYSSFFTDELCMQLKGEYASMSDEQLTAAMAEIPADLVAAALKVKNDKWAEYEKEFRVHTYEPYTDPDTWGTKLLTKKFTWQNNPTGIYANTAEILYVFVKDDVPAGATLEIETLTDNGSRGNRTAVVKGMNVIPVSRDLQTIFVIYNANTMNGKAIADYPDIDIRIEGGVLNGYWDVERHDDADWVYISQKMAKHPYIVVKGRNFIFNMVRDYMILDGYCKNKITDAIGWWDNMADWQWSIMGLEDVRPSHFNNKLCARTLPTGYQSATNYYTQYLASYINNLLPYEQMMSNADNCWGPAHENGHVHQEAITPINCSEVSNNLFSNLVLYKLGRWQSRGGSISEIAAEYVKGLSWPSHSNHLMLRMYWQLYLYYHVAGNNSDFYPTLFKLLREDPIVKVGSSNKSYINKGSDDLLHFAEKCCEASGEDMTNFFEAWGFFVPMHENHYGDYADYYLTSTEEMIAETKAKMATYKKKAGAIEFIEDRVKGVPRTDGGSGNKLSHSASVSNAGELGHFTDFTPEKQNVVAKDYVYTKSSTVVTITSGTGAVGFKVIGADGKMLTYSNTHKIQLTALQMASDFTVVAVQANGEYVNVPSAAEAGTEEQQLTALNSALTAANTCISNVSATGTQVGYFYAEAVEELKTLYAQALAARDNKDQSVNTYGKWAVMLEEVVKELKNNKYAYIGIKEKNIHTLINRAYPAYGVACDNGIVAGAATSAIPRDDERRNWEFVSTGTPDEFYIKSSNGSYISSVAADAQVSATAKQQSLAVIFVAQNNGDATYSFSLKSNPALYLGMNKDRDVIGTSSSNTKWRLTIVEDNATANEKEQLGEFVTRANNIIVELGGKIVPLVDNIDGYKAALQALAGEAEAAKTPMAIAKALDALKAENSKAEVNYILLPQESANGLVWRYRIKSADGLYCYVDTENTTSTYSNTIGLTSNPEDEYSVWEVRATENENEFYLYNVRADKLVYSSNRSYIKVDGKEDATPYLFEADKENGALVIMEGKKYWGVLNTGYIKLMTQVANWRLEYIGSVTEDIEEVLGDDAAAEGVYDLQGRRIKDITAPGLYIVNGKKVLVK